jgi:hypothetical protein
MKYWPTKTSQTVRDHGLNWLPTLESLAAKLGIGTPVIVNSIWEKLHGDADISTGSFDAATTTARVIGGTAGQETVFRNTVTLDNGMVLDEDVFQKIRA